MNQYYGNNQPYMGWQQYPNQPAVNNYTNPYAKSAQAIGLHGAIVSDMNQITADSVPMDGSIAVFPKQDLSEIYVKNWNSDGTIRTITFKPTPIESGGDAGVDDNLEQELKILSAKVHGLEERIKQLNRKPYKKGNYRDANNSANAFKSVH